ITAARTRKSMWSRMDQISCQPSTPPAHIPAKACPALDAGWRPVRRQGYAPTNLERHLPAVPQWNANACMNDTSATPASPPAVALAGVNLSLGSGAARVHILKDITLNIGRGEAVGLVGPSGSGKSTLLMVMAGLERADTGSVMVAGEDIGRLDEDALARFCGRHVGIVF